MPEVTVRRAKTWKATERKVAQRLGAERNSKKGLGEDVPDVIAGPFAVEVKHRRKLPALLRQAMAQAVRNARDEQTPVVVLHETGQRHDDDCVIMRLADFERWYGSLETGERLIDQSWVGDEPNPTIAEGEETCTAKP